MANKGALNLKSSALLGLYHAVSGYETTIQNALYDQYKAAYKISLTNHMRGSAADAFKRYFCKGTLNMIQGMLDISSEMTMILQFITEAFYQFESADAGKIYEVALDGIQSSLSGYKKVYDGMGGELSAVLSNASRYIAVTGIEFEAVDAEYGNVERKLQQIRDELYMIDDEVLRGAEQLLARIIDLKNLVSQTMGLCYQDGDYIPDRAAGLSKQPWYSEQGNLTLSLLLEEDPFKYEAGATTISEEQWAAGLCSDVYAYGGYSWLGGSYEMGWEKGSVFAKAKGNVLSINGYAQLTDYIKAQGDVKVGYGEVDAKAGAGDGYFGAHIKAEAGVVKVNGKVVIGSENFNGYVNLDAQVCCVDGKAAFEFEKDGQYAVGVDASATLASAGAEGGLSFLSYKVHDGTATGKEKDNLFKIKVSADAGLDAGFAVYSESKKAIEGDLCNINALTLKIKGKFLVGGCVQITVPTVYFKWPW